jgi:hypothetical protein
MNIRDDIRQLKTGPRELRKFGLLVGGVAAALGLLFLLRHKAHWPWFLWPGAVLIACGAAWPRGLKWLYVVWMSLAFVLGFVMAHVILTLLFFLMITPIGLVARASGKDFLRLKLDRSARTYWLAREQKSGQPAGYERQF